MNQEAFEAQHEAQWAAFEQWLDWIGTRRKRGAVLLPPLPEASIPHRYRTLCQHLALARDRQYSPGLVERLNRLVMRGHQFLYGAHPEAGPAVVAFFARDFARSVRRHWRPLALSAALFFLPLLLVAAGIQHRPDLIHTIMSPQQILDYQQMYDPVTRRPGQRGAQTDTMAFGQYIWNNIRIGFQTFAGGLLFGVGSAFYLALNGVLIGATAGHLINVGYATPFFSFVAGHSALELTGIVLMGAAGLMLGSALVLPGASTRTAALRMRARAAVPLVYGAGALIAGAAVIEAFWSSNTAIPATVKYAVGLSLWLLVWAYFLLAGRDRAA